MTSPLEYRPLTPHPMSGVVGPIPTTMQPYPPQNAAAQEYWARRDRQLMARDIYVMLATFCRGDSVGGAAANPTLGTSYGSAEQIELLGEFAQFSVNVVDALDRDNVITLFEYDINLSNGWNLDDNSATGGNLNPGLREQDRRVVVGVESQQLALSETLWVHQAKLSADNSHTPFNEKADKHHFLFTELRNLQPTSVPLYEPGVTAGATTAVWRVRRSNIYDGAGSNKGKAKGKGKGKGAGQFKGNWSNSPVLPDPITLGNVTPATMAADEAILYFKDNGANSIAAGGQFTIATGDPYLGAGWPVDLYVDRDSTPSTFELVAPNAAGSSTFTYSSPPTVGMPLTKRSDLDLVVDSTGARHQVEVSTAATSSGFFDRNTAPAGGDCALILERRMNPKLPQLPLAENPWVAVDYMEVRQRDLGVLTSDDETIILSTRLPEITSVERSQPLDGDNVKDYAIAGVNQNSINSTSNTQPWNSNCPPVPPVVGPKAFDIHQMHFDRDFSSSIELLNLPLTGPKELTRSLGDDSFGAALLGRERFMHTDSPKLGAGGTAINGNHWHRLLSFVEVPTKSHRQLGNPFQLSRIPGKVNLNTIRHPEVLGGVLDAQELVLAPDAMAMPARFGLQSNLPGTVINPIRGTPGPRDLWADFLVARDGFDPLTRLSLPGVAALAGTNGTIRTNGSRPFRDLSFDINAAPNGSVEQTILRGQLAHTWAGSASAEDQKQERLFDIEGEGKSDPYVRSRLLSKIMGSTTTRSNVFFVYMTVRFHEVYEDASGNQRVGGRYDLNQNGNSDDDTHRGFFILDRSNAEEAFNIKTGAFDWKEVVKYRLTIN